MIEIEDKIVSQDIFEEYFCCDLAACKGICCVEGDSGAPLEVDEVDEIDKNIEIIKKYMTPEGAEAIDEQGIFVIDSDGDLTTPLVNGAECAYTVNEGGLTLCAIEKAYRAGEIDYKKPISCHLYPIRTKTFNNGMIGLNYHRWSVCSDAVKCGLKSKVKVYQSLKEPIIRAFGETFYQYLTEVDEIIEKGEIEGV
ncbi:MAG: DUF3109 family protein [Rikenellaceae bacterium]